MVAANNIHHGSQEVLLWAMKGSRIKPWGGSIERGSWVGHDYEVSWVWSAFHSFVEHSYLDAGTNKTMFALVYVDVYVQGCKCT